MDTDGQVGKSLHMLTAKEQATVPDMITSHSDFREGDQVELCDIQYRVHKVTRKDLVLRRVK